MDEERGKYQYSALRFMFEMELTKEAPVINTMKMNAFDVAPRMIKDVEFLSSYEHRAMLIWVDLNWFGKNFFRKKIEAEVLDRIQQLLPNLRLRVISDRKIFDLALDKVKIALKGEKNEEAITKSVGDASSSSDSSSGT